jgi:hypothetical protein
MKIRLTLLTVSLLLAHQAMAKDVPLSTAHDIANTTTPASESQAFDSWKTSLWPRCVLR